MANCETKHFQIQIYLFRELFFYWIMPFKAFFQGTGQKAKYVARYDPP